MYILIFNFLPWACLCWACCNCFCCFITFFANQKSRLWFFLLPGCFVLSTHLLFCLACWLEWLQKLLSCYSMPLLSPPVSWTTFNHYFWFWSWELSCNFAQKFLLNCVDSGWQTTWIIWLCHKMLLIAEIRYICLSGTFCWASSCWPKTAPCRLFCWFFSANWASSVVIKFNVKKAWLYGLQQTESILSQTAIPSAVCICISNNILAHYTWTQQRIYIASPCAIQKLFQVKWRF